MAEVSQPSSLTLEPNPFEQSFASKAQEQSAQKSGAVPAGQETGNDKESRRESTNHTAVAGTPSSIISTSKKGGDGNEIPGIDKIMTPLPLIHGSPAVSGAPYSLNVINVPGGGAGPRWIPPRQGPYTPSIVGTPTFEGYIAHTVQPPQAQASSVQADARSGGQQLPHSGVKAEKPLIDNPQLGPATIPAADSFPRPLPMESPGILMPVAQNIMFSPIPSSGTVPMLSPHAAAIHAQQQAQQQAQQAQQHGHDQSRIQAPPQQQLHVPAGAPGGHIPQPEIPAQTHIPPHGSAPNLPHADQSGAPRGPGVAANGLYMLSQNSSQLASASNHGKTNPYNDLQHGQAPQPDQTPSEPRPPHEANPSKNPRKMSASKGEGTVNSGPLAAGSADVSPSSSHASPPVKKRSIPDPHGEDPESAQGDVDSKRFKSYVGHGGAEVDEGERRKMFLERNRIAAIKCRQRKKQWVDELKSKADIYSQLNEELQRNNGKLKSDIEQLRQFIVSYHDPRSLPPHILTILNAHMPQMHNAAPGGPVGSHWYPSQHAPQQHPAPPHSQQQQQQPHQQQQQQLPQSLQQLSGPLGAAPVHGAYPQNISPPKHHLQQGKASP